MTYEDYPDMEFLDIAQCHIAAITKDGIYATVAISENT